MKVVAIIQARLGSVRFPGKVLRPICGTPLIGLLLQRLSRSEQIDQIVLAVPESSRNEPLAQYVSDLGYTVFRGSESDVLDRYYQAARLAHADVVIRITGDCPLIDPAVVDAVVKQFLRGGADYVSTGDPRSFPNGIDTEVFSFSILERAWKEASDSYSREHVTPYIRTQPGIIRGNYAHTADESNRRWTVDEPEDLEVVAAVFEHFHPRTDFGWLEVLSLQQEHPEQFLSNQHIPYNEGASMGVEQKLMRRASRVLLDSDNERRSQSETEYPKCWPTYFKEAKGCRVRGLDDREYLDMSSPGIRKRILGYGHPEVEEAVIAAVRSGSNSTLNEEVLLAEKLIEIHPWAEAARFARSEKAANELSIRIGQKVSGRSGVAVCGSGIAAVSDNTFPFSYGNLQELEGLVSLHDIGVIKVDLARCVEPSIGWLKELREYATRRNIILVFDECCTGFRKTFGGVHKKLGIDPDIAIFGEVIGNGYSISAAIGRKDVMEADPATDPGDGFIPGRMDLVAALKTLEIMGRDGSGEKIARLNDQICDRWRSIGGSSGLSIDIHETSAAVSFDIRNTRSLADKKVIADEMFKKGILATNQVFVSAGHEASDFDEYISRLADVLGLIPNDGRPGDSL